MRRRTSDVIRFLMVLIIATACGSANPTVATKTPVSAAILDDHFGFLVGNAVRTESDTKPLFVLPIPEDTAGVVSPDGRRLAYVGSNDVRVIDIAPKAQPRTLFTVSGEEGGAYLAWSSDSTGLVFGVTGPPSPVNEGPPSYTKASRDRRCRRHGPRCHPHPQCQRDPPRLGSSGASHLGL